ncbi:MAG: ABC transporter ATP-binding protein [Candidatus Hodarchaeota archaeon]
MQKTHSPTFARWFTGHLLASPLTILVVIGGTILVISARMLIPLIIGNAMDMAIIDLNDVLLPSEQLNLLIQFAVLLLGIGLFRLFIGFIRTFAQERLSWGAQRRIRESFFDSIQNKPLKFHDATPTGEIMALATNDMGQVGGFLSFGFATVTEVIISLVITSFLVVSVLNSIELILVSIPFLLVYIWAIRHYNGKMGPISQTFMRKWSGIAVAIQDNIQGAEVVRAFGEEDYERKKFMDYVVDFRDTWEKRQIIQARYYPTLVLYAAIGFSFLLSCFLVANGRLTIGGLIAFNGMLLNLLVPTYVISFAVDVFNAGLAGARRIYKAMYTQEGENGNENGKLLFPSTARGEIRFENVTFKYPQSKRPVLEDINLHIEPYQTVAIVGPTGSGKSSLVKLLLRLYEYKGTIKIDDVDIKNYKLESLRKGIGLIEQDIYLFPRSIRENIAIGSRDAAQSEIEQAAKLAQIHDFIMSQKDQYELNVGEGGSQLSGGQKQRVAIARTFLTNPRILILDDSTSSVDSRTEEKIIKAIAVIAQNRTTFIITHRLSLIRNADCVIVLKEGTVVAKGHHSELIRQSPDYRRIFGKDANLPPLEVESKTVQVIAGGS